MIFKGHIAVSFSFPYQAMLFGSYRRRAVFFRPVCGSGVKLHRSRVVLYVVHDFPILLLLWSTFMGDCLGVSFVTGFKPRMGQLVTPSGVIGWNLGRLPAAPHASVALQPAAAHIHTTRLTHYPTGTWRRKNSVY